MKQNNTYKRSTFIACLVTMLLMGSTWGMGETDLIKIKKIKTVFSKSNKITKSPDAYEDKKLKFSLDISNRISNNDEGDDKRLKIPGYVLFEVTERDKNYLVLGAPVFFDHDPSIPETYACKASAYKDYCIQILFMKGRDKIVETLELTPTLKPLEQEEYPNVENFFMCQEFDFSLCLSPFTFLLPETDEKKEVPPVLSLRLWENRHFMTYRVYTEKLREALACFSEGVESFEQILYERVSIRKYLEGNAYLLGETQNLKQAWKDLYNNIVIFSDALKDGKSSPYLHALNLADLFPIYINRLERYIDSFANTTYSQETEFNRLLDKRKYPF